MRSVGCQRGGDCAKRARPCATPERTLRLFHVRTGKCARPGNILTGGGRLEALYKAPEFPWTEEQLPHYHKLRGDTHEVPAAAGLASRACVKACLRIGAECTVAANCTQLSLRTQLSLLAHATRPCCAHTTMPCCACLPMYCYTCRACSLRAQTAEAAHGNSRLCIWQKRPMYMAKETYLYGTRDLFI